MTVSLPTISPEQQHALQAVLDEFGKTLPGCSLTVASDSNVLFDGRSGKFDALEEETDSPRAASKEDVLWFASTTKLITSVAYLQLVDQGTLTLDSDLSEYYPPLREATRRVFRGTDDQGQPIWEDSHTAVTLRMMLNQTSGFGMEFLEGVQGWKSYSGKGTGFVNSCKVDNLIHTPIVEQPGVQFQYGNSAEWLGLILPHIVNQSTEDYMQQHIFQPLGMRKTTFYPFGPEFKSRLMPLRFYDNEKREWQVLDQQMPGLTLPRSREEIEYPVAGGGIYSTSTDYTKLLQELLKLFRTSPNAYPKGALLSRESVQSLFQGSLPESAKGLLAHVMNMRPPQPGDAAATGEWDWSTGMVVWTPADGRRLGKDTAAKEGGWGRRASSVGWFGAAGTMYFIDPESNLTFVCTTQMLPGDHPSVSTMRNALEKQVYVSLQA
ncbi:hypothetical protein NliqN6_0659 [Naganishia liquefaciens]|uniref:Beta-lactamase-related domain-containing protein n=1 Tax=Naganishia liquefaciens TaxID=104408 RepID=A0A8H3TNB8_9TREE|nr:hypothetical protein NliqN6_0659 [Naganishia liquefaciens]